MLSVGSQKVIGKFSEKPYLIWGGYEIIFTCVFQAGRLLLIAHKNYYYGARCSHLGADYMLATCWLHADSNATWHHSIAHVQLVDEAGREALHEALGADTRLANKLLQKAKGRRQKAIMNERQKAEGRRQKAEGRRQS